MSRVCLSTPLRDRDAVCLKGVSVCFKGTVSLFVWVIERRVRMFLEKLFTFSIPVIAIAHCSLSISCRSRSGLDGHELVQVASSRAISCLLQISSPLNPSQFLQIRISSLASLPNSTFKMTLTFSWAFDGFANPISDDYHRGNHYLTFRESLVLFCHLAATRFLYEQFRSQNYQTSLINHNRRQNQHG